MTNKQKSALKYTAEKFLVEMARISVAGLASAITVALPMVSAGFEMKWVLIASAFVAGALKALDRSTHQLGKVLDDPKAKRGLFGF